MEGTVEGAFLMAVGSQARDRNHEFSVIIEELRLGEIESLLLEFKETAGQEKYSLRSNTTWTGGCFKEPVMTTEQRMEQINVWTLLSPQRYSRMLFGPAGLFQELAKTAEERKALVQTDLFKRANTRFTELLFQARHPSDGIHAELSPVPNNGAARDVKSEAIPANFFGDTPNGQV